MLFRQFLLLHILRCLLRFELRLNLALEYASQLTDAFFLLTDSHVALLRDL